MKRSLASILVVFTLGSCKTVEPVKSRVLNDAVEVEKNWLPLWQTHIQEETTGKSIQQDCMPRYYPASKPSKGMVMFFHGFTACPQQYFAIGERLSAMGYDVFLPLSPGHGREPFDGAKGDQDNFKDLPSTAHAEEYVAVEQDNQRLAEFVQKMNAIASLHPGPRYLAGLSGEELSNWSRCC